MSDIKTLLKKPNVIERFEELLKDKAPSFISSVLQIVNTSPKLSVADPQTVMNAAATAAILDLPINQNLGYAWIVPYNVKQPDGSYKVVAQFQMGAKGYIQLGLRTSQYIWMNGIAVHKNQFGQFNRFTEELLCNFNIEGDSNIVGYAAGFALGNGFKKTIFWSAAKMQAHAVKYSKSYNSYNSLWKDPIESVKMGEKTIIKSLLSKWGILSVEMQKAIIADQSIQYQFGQHNYNDSPTIGAPKDDNGNTQIITPQKAVAVDLEKLIGEAENWQECEDIRQEYRDALALDFAMLQKLNEHQEGFQNQKA